MTMPSFFFLLNIDGTKSNLNTFDEWLFLILSLHLNVNTGS